MIVRLLTEGQYRVSEELTERLSELDDEAVAALDRDDEEELDGRLEEMWSLVRDQGDRVPEDEIVPSDVIIPPSDLTLDETRQLFSGDGLIPDIPAP
jgi:hypothetical protein